MSKSLPVMQAKSAIDKAFPGSPSPAVVVIEGRDVTTPQVKQAIANFEQKAVADGYAFKPFTLNVSADHSVARLYVPIKGDGHNAEAVASMKALRSSVVPQTLNSTAGVTAQVAGEAAGTEDFSQVMRDRAPLVIGFVLLLSFLLLLVTFRSLIIPIKAILLNLLSVGAAYGILVAVFQHSWAQGLLGFKSDGAIESWLPIFLFVVLFGLSMDYHVFILSRVRELWERGVPTEQAVEQGITETAGVVTSAAVVMVAVFAIFATLSGLDMKQLGVGLSTAILLDATLVRGVLLPATMKLLGEHNWYLPKKLNHRETPDVRTDRCRRGGEAWPVKQATLSFKETGMSASNGITGKVGRWSARHPWTAISLWIAFVAAAVVIGGAVGTKKLTEAESASGESGVAARTLDKAGFKIQPGEQVLVQSKTLRAGDPAFRAVVGDVIKRLDAHAERRQAALPLRAEHDLARTGTPRSSRSRSRARSTPSAPRSRPSRPTTAAAQAAHPGF